MSVNVIIIHGLNNNLEAFAPLAQALQKRGHTCELICLPGHGENRDETLEMEEAFRCFDESLKSRIREPYVVIAFSQGGLYLQLWLEKAFALKPRAQVLLAPALYIRRFSLLKTVMGKLPDLFKIQSQLPRPLRRYDYLYIREYHHLFRSNEYFREHFQQFHIPTLILVDERDELVDAKALKLAYGNKVEIWKRPYLKWKKPGKYHILFHPLYFSESDWERFLARLEAFFSAAV